MPNSNETVWVGVPMPPKWRQEFRRRAARNGTSAGYEVLTDLAAWRCVEVPPHRLGRKKKS